MSETLAVGSSEITATDVGRCIQISLTSLGYDTNGVDGVIGGGTQAAFRAYAADAGIADFFIADPAWRTSLCLTLADESGVSGFSKAVAAALAKDAMVQVRASIQAGAKVKFVFMDEASNELGAVTEVSSLNDGSVGGEVPYELVKDAAQMCAVFFDGWVFKDENDQRVASKCDDVHPGLLTRPSVTYTYRTTRGDPDS